jgi:hypothetical protein
MVIVWPSLARVTVPAALGVGDGGVAVGRARGVGVGSVVAVDVGMAVGDDAAVDEGELVAVGTGLSVGKAVAGSTGVEVATAVVVTGTTVDDGAGVTEAAKRESTPTDAVDGGELQATSDRTIKAPMRYWRTG